jgi:hypothetical protein
MLGTYENNVMDCIRNPYMSSMTFARKIFAQMTFARKKFSRKTFARSYICPDGFCQTKNQIIIPLIRLKVDFMRTQKIKYWRNNLVELGPSLFGFLVKFASFPRLV